MLYFGSHISTNKGLITAAQKIKDSGGNMLQIFKPDKDIDSKSCKLFKQYLVNNKMKVVVHSSYKHNLANSWDSSSWWIKNILSEIQFCYKIGAVGLVIHTGKQLNLTLPEAYNNVYTSLIHIHNKTKDCSDVKILLETASGQGSEICYKIEDLAHLYRKISKSPNSDIRKRVKLCIDTCHIFSAGYDIRTKNSVKMYLEAFEELIGVKNVKLIHFNDSKVDIGCRKDRHQNIGKGFIGVTGLTEVFKQFKRLNVPIILETPNKGYKTEINLYV